MANETTDAGKQATTAAASTVSADAQAQVTPAQTSTDTSVQMVSTDAAGTDDLDIIARLAMEPTPSANTTNVPQSTDEGTMTRIQQQNAKMRETLIRMGMDPDTVDSTLNQPVVPQYVQPQPQRQTDPKSALDALLNKVQKQNGVTMDDFAALANTLKGTIDSLDRKEYQSAESENLNTCISAIKGVLSTDPIHQKLPPAIQRIEEDLFIAGTDYALLSDAKGRKVQDPRQLMTPQNYQQFAKKMTESLKQLRSFYISIGNRTPKPVTTTENVQPLTNSSGFTPAMPRPASGFDANDVAGSIRRYQAGIKRL
jgi:hypothetical protein